MTKLTNVVTRYIVKYIEHLETGYYMFILKYTACLATPKTL